MLNLEALTDRQREILPLVASGMANKEIAKAMHLAEGTVRVHVFGILRALGFKNRTLVAAAYHQDPGIAGAAEVAKLVRSKAGLADLVRHVAPDVVRIVALEEAGTIKPHEARTLIEGLVAAGV